MKKNKSKSKNHSTNKKLRKELESKLTFAFNELVNQYGKAKKTDKVIEKFAKQLVKKVNIPVVDDLITASINEEKAIVADIEEKPVKVVSTKKTKASLKEAELK
ncbi:hypothetical protein [uncultured Pedobacter sp.]|uniref:hypothetical protein n=1 Tax=uncultured Pedobacter sp. TaxID=246139 RepID=UPI0025FC2510|nr:hypothetical protein [uncultured Pedobacter sp.]